MIDHEALLGLQSELYRNLNTAQLANAQAQQQIAGLTAENEQLRIRLGTYEARDPDIEEEPGGPPAG